MKEWLQTEWPELKVYLTSVTEQWAVATLSGPAARDILEAAGTNIDLSDDGFGFMSMREHVSGLPAGYIVFPLPVNCPTKLMCRRATAWPCGQA